MRRDANFGIGDAEIQVKEDKKTDKSNIILVFRYLCCRNSRKRWREKLTLISSVGLPKFNFRYILFFVGLNPCARTIPHEKQPADYRLTCIIYMGTKLIYPKLGRYFKFSKTHIFLYTFQKLIVMITRIVNSNYSSSTMISK